MEVRIKSEKLMPETRDYLGGRLAAIEKLLGKAADLARCEVEITRAAGRKHSSDHMWCAEMHIMVPGYKTVYAQNHAQTVNAAIDDVKEEVERQIRKEKKASRRDTKKKGEAIKRMSRGDA